MLGQEIPATGHAVKVAPEERLFSLVLALLATERGLTKEEILSSVQGYRAEYRSGGDNTSLERKFERDKNGLRELGVPVDVVDDPAQPGNNQLTRYRIPRGSYELPAEVRFTGKEIALLNLAGMAWQEGSLSGESRRALLKLASLGVAADDPVIGYAPRIRVRDRAFEPLSAAVLEGSQVRFRYLKPGEQEASMRTVAPLALVQHRGRWHLYGSDRDRGAKRTFLISRIVGEVRRDGLASPESEGGHHERALAELDELWLSNRALVKPVPGTDAGTRLSKLGEVQWNGTVELHYTDEAVLADELAGFGPEVAVLEPTSLAEAVHSRRQHVAARHGGGLAGDAERGGGV